MTVCVLTTLANLTRLKHVPIDLLKMVTTYARGFEGKRVGTRPIVCTGFMAVSPSSGALFMTDAKRNTVTSYADDGRTLAEWGDGRFVMPHEVVVTPTGLVLVSERSSGRIQVLEEHTGCLVHSWMAFEPSVPFCMALTPNNQLAVATKSSLVRLYDLDGVLQWERSALERPYAFLVPQLCCVTVTDDNGLVTLNNYRATTIHHLTHGTVSGPFNLESCATQIVTLDNEVLALTQHNRVEVYTQQGRRRRCFKAPQRRAPTEGTSYIGVDSRLCQVLVATTGRAIKVYM